jgi:hypothetical protein
MRTSVAEKLEVIRVGEESCNSVKQILTELDIPRSTCYRWSVGSCHFSFENYTDMVLTER